MHDYPLMHVWRKKRVGERNRNDFIIDTSQTFNFKRATHSRLFSLFKALFYIACIFLGGSIALFFGNMESFYSKKV